MGTRESEWVRNEKSKVKNEKGKMCEPHFAPFIFHFRFFISPSLPLSSILPATADYSRTMALEGRAANGSESSTARADSAYQ
jgi:hypothetical protein